MRKVFMVVCCIVLVTAACAVKIPENTPAPPLKIAAWLKGEPVDLAAIAGKKAAVIEFWATWCPPCRENIPHLTKLQQQYNDRIVFVGVTNESADEVNPFLQKMGDKMDYTVAIDDRDQTGMAYMDKWGLNNIPYAFVVGKDGNIAWHGFPEGDAFEAALKKVAEK